ncbi:ribosome maturation factor RimM [Microvirga terricola]|uniref:Ribosome maturation factor RimM n=1 Tax=Microvirga terricola TaxID=2719797 RepID=A0ABX0VAN9_9HYPH|nr:ribosome maturation factor RimM [Microvirga terricola]
MSTVSSPGSLRSRPSPVKGEARGGLILVGEFGRAHGLKGEVRLKSYTGDPVAIAAYKPLTAADGRVFSLKNPRQAPGGAPDMLVVRVEGVTSREAAEALNRVQLHVDREKLPKSDDEDEFLLADLIGLPVQDDTGAILGTIVDVPNYGGGDLLEIKPASSGATALLPFTKAFVPVVEIAQKRIVVALPEDFFAPAKAAPEDEA